MSGAVQPVWSTLTSLQVSLRVSLPVRLAVRSPELLGGGSTGPVMPDQPAGQSASQSADLSGGSSTALGGGSTALGGGSTALGGGSTGFVRGSWSND